MLWFGKTKVVLGLILESVEPIQHQNLDYKAPRSVGCVATLFFCLRCSPEPSSIHHIALPHPAPPDNMPYHCKSEYCTSRCKLRSFAQHRNEAAKYLNLHHLLTFTLVPSNTSTSWIVKSWPSVMKGTCWSWQCCCWQFAVGCAQPTSQQLGCGWYSCHSLPNRETGNTCGTWYLVSAQLACSCASDR